ncbi:MAG: hypothetical protein EHM86_02745 [Desulfobulbaceae bacterium]|nr:MAG: hypothetical protein EHM86_02745 [Desulfobulbaceae bacterium]
MTAQFLGDRLDLHLKSFQLGLPDKLFQKITVFMQKTFHFAQCNDKLLFEHGILLGDVVVRL